MKNYFLHSNNILTFIFLLNVSFIICKYPRHDCESLVDKLSEKFIGAVGLVSDIEQMEALQKDIRSVVKGLDITNLSRFFKHDEEKSLLPAHDYLVKNMAFACEKKGFVYHGIMLLRFLEREKIRRETGSLSGKVVQEEDVIFAMRSEAVRVLAAKLEYIYTTKYRSGFFNLTEPLTVDFLSTPINPNQTLKTFIENIAIKYFKGDVDTMFEMWNAYQAQRPFILQPILGTFKDHINIQKWYQNWKIIGGGIGVVALGCLYLSVK